MPVDLLAPPPRDLLADQPQAQARAPRDLLAGAPAISTPQTPVTTIPAQPVPVIAPPSAQPSGPSDIPGIIAARQPRDLLPASQATSADIQHDQPTNTPSPIVRAETPDPQEAKELAARGVGQFYQSGVETIKGIASTPFTPGTSTEMPGSGPPLEEYQQADVMGQQRAQAVQGAIGLDIPPPETVGETIVDTGAGLAAFMAKLAIAKKLAVPKGFARTNPAAAEAVAWETVHQADAGGRQPGVGAAQGAVLGAINAIPARSIGDEAAKLGAEVGFQGAAMKAQGAEDRDETINALLPFAMRAVQGLRGGKVHPRDEQALRAARTPDEIEAVVQRAQAEAQPQSPDATPPQSPQPEVIQPRPSAESVPQLPEPVSQQRHDPRDLLAAMPRFQPDLKIAEEWGDQNGSQYDQRLIARDPSGQPVGRVDVSYEGSEPSVAYVRWVEVPENMRRRGIASAMYDWIKKSQGVTSIQRMGGVATPEGAGFRQAYTRREVGTLPAEVPQQRYQPRDLLESLPPAPSEPPRPLAVDSGARDDVAPVDTAQPLPTQQRADGGDVQSWQSTRDAYVAAGSQAYGAGSKARPQRIRDLREAHRAGVEQAVREGKPVPPEVLADYQDLAPSQPAPTPLPAQAAPEALRASSRAESAENKAGFDTRRQQLKDAIEKGRKVPRPALEPFLPEPWAAEQLEGRKPTRPPTENAINKKQDIAALKRALIEKYGIDIADTDSEPNKLIAFRDNRPELLLSDQHAAKLAQGDDTTFSADDLGDSLTRLGHKTPNEVITRLVKRGILKAKEATNAVKEGHGQQDVSPQPDGVGGSGRAITDRAQSGDGPAPEVGKFYEGTNPQQAGIFGQPVTFKNTGAQDALAFETQGKKLPVEIPGATAKDAKIAEQYDPTQTPELLSADERSALNRPLGENLPGMKPADIETRRVTDHVRRIADNMEGLARRRLKARGFRMKSGVDPSELADWTMLGAAKVLRGAANFADWSKEMVKMAGESIRPRLPEIYESSKTAAERLQVRGREYRKPARLNEIVTMVRKSLDEKPGQKTIGRPELANPAETETGRRIVDAVDETRKEQGIPEPRKQQAVRAEAETLLADPAKKADLQTRVRAGERLNDTDTAAAKMLVSERVKNLKGASEADLVEAAELVDGYREGGTETARAMGIRRDWHKSPAERMREFIGRALLTPPEKMRKQMGDNLVRRRKVLQQWVKRVNEIKRRLKRKGLDLENLPDEILEDPIVTAKVMRELSIAKADTGDKLYEFWINSLLSNPLTHVVNTVGNAVNVGVEVMQRPVDATINLIVRDPKSPQFSEMVPMVKAVPRAVRSAFRNAVLTMKTGRPTLETQILGPDATPSDKIEGIEGAISGRTGQIVRAPGRALRIEDEFFKSLTAELEATAQAHRIAKAEGLKDDAMSKRMDVLLADKESEPWKASLIEAKRLAFQEELPEFMNYLMLARNKTHEAIGKLPVPVNPKYAFPFVTTMVNIGRTGFSKTPLAAPVALYRGARQAWGAYKNGAKHAPYSSNRIIRDVSNQLISTATVALIMGLNSDPDQPMITGSVPYKGTERKERDFSYRTAPPMSIRFGDTWYSYSRVEPFATMLSTIVDLNETRQKIKQGEGADAALGRLYTQISSQIKEKTFAEGIAEIINAIEDPKYAGRMIRNFYASWVPNIIRASARNTDDFVRDRGVSFTHSALPIPAFAPPPKVDAWGNDTTKNLPMAARFFSPVQTFKTEPNEFDKLIVAHNAKHPNEQYFPSVPTRSFTRAGKKYEMTDQEYHDFLVASGKRALTMLRNQHRGLSPTPESMKKIESVFDKEREAVRDSIKNRRAASSAK